MDIALYRVLVRTILEHAEDYDWRMQESGSSACASTTTGSIDCTYGTRAATSGSLPCTTTRSISPRRSSPAR